VPETRTWIQGNVKSADIRLFRGKAALFDFGTCGLGVPYEDLAGLCAQLLLFRAALLFPWWLPRRAMSFLLGGYGEEFEYDRGELLDYLARGVFRYYLKNVLQSAWKARISGIPLIRGRVEYLIRQMADGEWSDALHGVDF